MSLPWQHAGGVCGAYRHLRLAKETSGVFSLLDHDGIAARGERTECWATHVAARRGHTVARHLPSFYQQMLVWLDVALRPHACCRQRSVTVHARWPWTRRTLVTLPHRAPHATLALASLRCALQIGAGPNERMTVTRRVRMRVGFHDVRGPSTQDLSVQPLRIKDKDTTKAKGFAKGNFFDSMPEMFNQDNFAAVNYTNTGDYMSTSRRRWELETEIDCGEFAAPTQRAEDAYEGCLKFSGCSLIAILCF